MTTWPTIARFIAAQGAAALVTLAQAQGSSPREVGARMVVAPDGTFTGTIGGGALEWGALAEAQALLARRCARDHARQGARARPRPMLRRARAADDREVRRGRRRHGARHSPRPSSAQGMRDDDRRARAGRTAVTLPRAGATKAARRARPMTCSRMAASTSASARSRRAFYLFGAGHVGRALTVALAPLPFAVTWIDTRPGAIPEKFPANVTAITQGDPVELLVQASGTAPSLP